MSDDQENNEKIMYVEPSLTTINDGELIEEFDEQLVGVCRELSKVFEQSNDVKARASVKLTVTAKIDKIGNVWLEHSVSRKAPARNSGAGASFKKGKVLVMLGKIKQPNAEITLFDMAGKTTGVLDRTTGEVVE